MANSDSEVNFAIMCSGTEFQDYAAVAIKRLLALNETNLKALIIPEEDKATDTSSGTNFRSKIQTIFDLKENRTWREIINYVTWYYHTNYFGPSECNQKTDLATELKDVDRIYCETRTERFSQYVTDDDLARIQELDLDFIFRRSFGILRGDILDTPTYGIWSYHHGDEREYRGGPPCFWEIYENEPITGAIIQRLTEQLDAGVVLRRGFFSTKQAYMDNVTEVKYGTAHFPEQLVKDILNGKMDYFDGSPTKTDAKIYKKPSPPQLLRYHFYRLRFKANILRKGLPKWNIGVIGKPITEIHETENPTIDWCPRTTPGGFIADPFSCEFDGRKFIFVESYSYNDKKGKISCVEYDDGFTSSWQTALEKPFHISYPYIFEHDERVYATPEMKSVNEIRLYTLNTPTDWNHETTIATGVRAVDPTVFKYDGTWWLFYTRDGASLSSNRNLEVWYAPQPTGPWEPHENNPVKTDVRSARPAGTPYRRNGALFRPSQYCAGEYGKKVVVNRVQELTPSSFSTKKSMEIKPGPDESYPAGRHTLSDAGEVTLIDGKRRVWNRYTLEKRVAQIRNKLRALYDSA